MSRTTPDRDRLLVLCQQTVAVFSQADDLAQAFRDEKARGVDETSWDRHRRAFETWCDAIEELKIPMMNPPEGFAPVAEALRKAASLAKRIDDVMRTPQGWTFQLFLSESNVLELKLVAGTGYNAIWEVRRALRSKARFRFLEQQAPSEQVGTDTPPELPRPPSGHVEGTVAPTPPPAPDGPR